MNTLPHRPMAQTNHGLRLLCQLRLLRAPHVVGLLRQRVPSWRSQVAELGTFPTSECEHETSSPKKHGQIHVIMGPMFAGKSTALVERVEAADRAGRRVVVVKSSVDTRYSASHVVTHAGRRLPCIPLTRLGNLRQALGDEAYDKVEVVAVDEAQFIEDLAESAVAAAEDDGKTVIVAGLSGDFKRQRFGQLLDLVPLADSVVKLEGRCNFCDQPSLFTLRIAAASQQQLVGGSESYAPVCRAHYRELHDVRQQGGAAAEEMPAAVAGTD